MANIIIDAAVLRPIEVSDLDALHRYRNDPDVTRTLVGFSSGYSRAAMTNWLSFTEDSADRVLWAIADPEDDTCLGHVGLYEIDYRIRKAEIGMLIGDKSRWGKGLGTAVKRAVIDYGFRELNLHKIVSTVLSNNPANIRVNEKLGFQLDGILRHHQFREGGYIDAVVMSLLEDEWRRLQNPADA